MSGVVPDWLADPALAGLWAACERRLQRNGLSASGRLRLLGLSRAERRALSGLLGRPVLEEECSVDLTALDRLLRERSGVGGLVEVVAAVTGRPVRDRLAERTLREQRRAAALDAARELVAAPWAQPWAGPWVNSLRATGILTGRPEAVATVEAAVSVLARLVPGRDRGGGPADLSRTELAAEATGDAHALDDDRILAAVVLRGLCAAGGAPWPSSASARRELWESFGVHPDTVSSTCLSVGLRPAAGSALGRRLGLAADAGAPVHLTAWDLRSWPTRGDGRAVSLPVLVCENPRVLEAVAQRHAGAIPVVCTSGEPNSVVGAVLGRLRGEGARLLSHGDFDWPGLGIVERLVERFAVEPWLMDAAAYRAGAREDGLALTGRPVVASWDPDLAPAMVEVGRAVHEEAVLSTLLDAVATHVGAPTS